MTSQLIVDGGRPLAGELRPAGFKHALVTLCAAALVGRAQVELLNCPDIVESRVLAALLTSLGGRVTQRDDTLIADLGDVGDRPLDPELSSRIHGAVYLLPGLLSRFGQAVVPRTGGCQIGARGVSPASAGAASAGAASAGAASAAAASAAAASAAAGGGGQGERPVRQYLDVLHRFGAQARERADKAIEASAERLHGCTVDLRDYTADRELRTGPLYSGATKMAILCAAAAYGESRLLHPYPKPDVTELVDLLRAMGADIRYLTPDELIVVGRGPAALGTAVRHELVTDLIEVVTWTCLAALHRSPITMTGVTVKRALAGLAPELRLLERMGVGLRPDGAGRLRVEREDELRPVSEVVSSHGIYSDSQPLLSLLATDAAGPSSFTETVWTERFGHVPGLTAMGARMMVCGPTLTVQGRCRPGIARQTVHAPDLRAAAALLVAALTVPGTTVITGSHHLARGYRDLPADLRGLGARVFDLPRQPAGDHGGAGQAAPVYR